MQAAVRDRTSARRILSTFADLASRGRQEMAIIRKPLQSDPPGKCSRWRVILYNAAKHKQEWVTVRGTRQDAESLERSLKDRVARRTYVARSERMTIKA